MPEYQLFDFTPEVVEKIRKTRTIPVDFYNRNGQVLIGKMHDASEERIEKLFHFMNQGIYFNEEDREKLGITKKQSADPSLGGLTYTNLFADEQVNEMTSKTSELFDHLKSSSLKSAYTRTSQKMMANIFTGFNQQDDAMVGLINILELMNGRDAQIDVKKSIKRIVTAMALKTRGLRFIQTKSLESNEKKITTDLMMSALLCDVGYMKMDMPKKNNLTHQEMEYIKNHPLLSYLMIVHDPVMTPQIKNTILTHHRPNQHDTHANNYPLNSQLLLKLESLRNKFVGDVSKKIISEDLNEQINMFKNDELYKEDSNILAISSEFASLTSETEWRPAFSSKQAVQMIINNSFFTYPGRIVREFLDHVSISLCNNQKILSEGDLVITTSKNFEHQDIFELCQIDTIGRFQSKPGVYRIATVNPTIENSPKLRIAGFDIKNMRRDPRRAHYDLQNDDTKRIVYAITRENNPTLYTSITEA